MSEAVIFTDGASRGNPGPAGWGAVIAYDDQVVELGAGIDTGTNNEAELTAIAESLQFLAEEGIDTATVYTDSAYAVEGITGWVYGWQKNGWTTRDDDPVKNKQLWQEIFARQKDKDISFEQIPGHAGIPANERADTIATKFADGATPDLFAGKQNEYAVSLDPTSQQLEKAPVYLSLVDGVVQQHSDWTDCKQRVEGVDAQYRKVMTEGERDNVLASWNKTPADIEN